MTYRLKALLLTFSLFCFGTLAKAQITASFTATQTNICEGIAVGFIPTINSTNPVASVFWDFGDSVFVIDPIPYGTGYVYNTAGTYTVRLVVNDILGNTDTTTVVNMITVNPNPDISLTVNPTAGCQPLDVQLTPTTSNSSTTGWTWTWTFSSDSICFAGDGRDTIIRTNPNPFTTTFTDDGIYDVKLVVENQLNCQSDTTVFNAFTVEPKPVASFTAQVQPDCDSTTNVVFTSTSALPCTPSPMYNWNFGDGTGSVTTTLSTYTYEYQTSGTFTVQLIVTDGIPNGCADTTTQTVVIAADPTVTIQAPNTACATESIQFNGSSSGVVTGWAWDFGDGNTSTLQNPTHTYANPGCFTPSLTVTIDTCTFTTVFDTCIIINPKPSAVFSSLDDFETCTRPHSMTFTSTVIGTLTPTYAWNFGDGTTSSDQNPTKTWNYAGTYPMSLTVSTPQGCSSPVLRDTVIIDSIDVNFTSDIVGGCEPVTVQFSDISTSFTGATGWLWRFGDGNTSTQQNPTHTYMSAGVYDVELVITTAQGCTDSLTMPNYINVGTPPTLSFTVSDNAPCINENISFINNSSSGTNWLWFNGLDTVYGFNIPDTFYAASGSYDVWLSAENNGCIDTLFQNNLINLTDLEVVIGTDGDCEISPTGVDFTDNSTGAVIDWAWDFGVDGITDDTSTSQNPSYTYPAVGEYVATLTITDASGCTLTDSTTVDLDPPVASFGWTTDTVECVSVDFPVEIIDSSENHSDDCRWILPDEITHLFGSSDSICEPIFSFDTVGVYDISLIVRSDQGCLDTITKQICATDVTAVANIDTTGGTGGLIKSPVTFIDNGNPIVGGNGGCIIQLDSLTGDTTYIAAIGTNPINCNDPNLSLYTGCTPLTVEFSDSSFGFPDSIVSYVWDFGDGNTSSEPNPTHTYTESSGALAYMVTLTVTNEFGVINTDTIPAFIRPTQPSSNFSISRDTVCTDLAVTAADSSSGFDLTYQWVFGNGDTSAVASPSFSYATEGNYEICLTVTDINGCDSTVCDSIVVIDPVANFSADTTYSACENLTVTFTDSSENTISWLWLFGNDSTSNLQNPAVVYSGTGAYDLTLIAGGAGGCQDTLTVSNFVQVDGPALASMSVSPTDSCEDHRVGFNIQGSNIGIVTIEFGDGTDTTFGTFTSIALDTTIFYVYDTAGIYNPVLRIEDSLNCERVFNFNTITTTDPLASFTIDTTLGCTPLAVTANGNMSEFANQYEWIAPGAFIAGQSTPAPTFIYQNEGYYNEITLVVTDVNGCTDTLSFTDTITAVTAHAGFFPDVTTGCYPLDVQFTDTSSAFADTIVAWNWQFVNGDTDTLQNPSYTYDGAVNVNQRARLTVTSSYGCTDVVQQNILPTFPTAAFIADSLACTEQTVNFTNQSTGLTLSYLWDFGDDSTSTNVNPTHFYESEDTFMITLTVTDVNGCVDIDTLERIIVADPIANFSSDKTFIACAPDSVQFTDLSQNAIAWDWIIEGADPEVYNIQNPAVAYTIPGSYDVQLIITSPSGCQDTMRVDSMITVDGPYGTLSFTPTEGCVDLTVDFVLPLTNTANLIFDNGESVEVFVNPGDTLFYSYTYTQRGTQTPYTPTVFIQDALGCQRTLTNGSITVTDPEPIFTVSPDTSCIPMTITTTNSSLDVDDFEWIAPTLNIDDPNNFTPTFTANNAGFHDISLVITDVYGCTDTMTQTILASDVTANASSNVTAGCLPLTVQFTDLSTDFPVGSINSWLWVFGDGNGVSTDQNPSYVYTTIGDFTPTLTVTNVHGCSKTFTLPSINVTFPNASYVPSLTFACTGQDILFDNQSSGQNVTYLWNFDNGQTSTDEDPIFAFANEGTYNVCLTTTDDNGCDSTYCQTITIANPVANFTVDNQFLPCPPATFNFTDASANAVSWFWTFGDGNTSTDQNPSNTYTETGLYDVQLIVTSASGCMDTLFQPTFIEVGGPVGNFTFTPNQGCADVTATFTGNVTSNTVDLYIWNFGDGSNSTSITNSNTNTVTHTYTTTGTFFPTLTLQDNAGCQFVATLDSIEVDTLQFDFFANDTLTCEVGDFTFTPYIASSSPIDSVRWNFVGADVTTSTMMSPTISYSNVGDFDVELTVYSRHCTKTITKTQYIKIAPNPVTNVLIAPTDGCNPTTVNFTDATTIFSGSVVSWAWDLGNGTTDTLQNTSTMYTAVGQYDVQLITVSNHGCADTLLMVDTVTIYPIPNPTFDLDTFACTGQDVFFTNTSTGINLTYNWNFGDGNISTDFEPVHQYASEGTFVVCLTVTSSDGCDSTLCKTVTIADPLAALSSNVVYVDCPGDSISFIDQSANAISWFWSFGDGDTSILQNPTHAYAATGFYDVQLIVTGLSGCQDTILQPAYIEVGGPVGNFTFTPNQGCADVTATFTGNVTSNTVDLYIWNFGDGSNSTSITNSNTNTVTHTYTTTGTFFPTLTLQDNAGCQFVATLDSIEVDTLQFDFIVDTTLACENGTFTFTPNIASSSPIDSIRWNFVGADVTTSNAMMPTITYSNVGDFDVELTVYSRHCTKTVTKSQLIKIAPNPVTNFTVSPAEGCNPTTVFFTDATTIFSGSIVSWAWDFGEGNVDSSQNTTNSYDTVGVFDVQLITVSDFGCTNTLLLTDTITINPIPNPTFDLDTFACTNQDVFFTNTSTGINLTYSWNFGDGNISTDFEPVHQYATEGTFTVCLTVTSSDGCDSTLCKTVTIADPLAAFTSNVQYVDCPSDSISFIDQSANAISWFWSFGDDSTSTEQNPTHAYAATGFYDVQLIVEGASGCFDTLNQVAYIEVGGPVGNFTFTPNQGCADVTATFTGNVTQNTVTQYIWNYGNGTIDTVASTSLTNTINHTYTSTGTFFPTLTLVDNANCPFVATLDSIEVDTLQFDFVVDTTLACENGTFTFTPTIASSSPIDSVVWNFVGADVTTSNAMMPTITYSNVGDFDVELTVYSRHCTKTVTKSQLIKIAPNPVTNFTVSPAEGCNPTTVFFTDATTIFSGSVVSWAWDFGEGSLDSSQNTTNSYDTVGVFDVQLITVSDFGCTNTLLLTDTITINPIPHPIFDLDTFACTNQDVFFTNTSTGNTLTYNWDFGDGNSSTAFEPVHQYTTEDTFTVCLTVTDVNGCDSTLCKTVIIANPVANFTSNTQYLACPPDSVQFTDASANTVAWHWTFGDGDTSIAQNPTHTYTTTGFYDVQLIVTGLSGCQDTLLQPAYIEVGGPVGNFTFTPKQGCADVTATFVGTLTANSVAQYHWNFGNGDSITHTTNMPIDSFEYIYTTAGTFFPTLVLEDSTGCQFDITLDSIEVDTLQFDFVASNTLFCETDVITFTPTIASSSPIDSMIWTFNGAIISTSMDSIPVIPYDTIGDFDVSLTVFSDHCSKTVTKTQYIKAAPIPESYFTTTTTPFCSEQTINFNDATNLFSGSVVSWNWNFGDLSGSNLQDPTHVYADSGFYNINLFVTSDFGCTDDTTITVYVNKTPEPMMTVAPTLCIGEVFTLTASGGDTYEWYEGVNLICDTCTSIDVAPIVTTNYTLVAISAAGCRKSITQTVNVLPYTIPPLEVSNDTTICKGDVIQLFASGGYDVTQYNWDASITGLSCYNGCSNPFASPEVTTTFYVTLTWDGGCSKTDSITVTIIDDAQPILGVDRTICQGESVQLGISTGGNATWFPGDGLSCVFCDNPVASPDVTTTYSVEVITVNGCTIRDTMTINVQTPDMINAGEDATICDGNTIELNGSAVGNVTWIPAATLSDSSIVNPIATPTVTTDYILTVQNDLCIQLDTVRITVADKVDIAVEDIEICEDEVAEIDIIGYAESFTFLPDTGVLSIDQTLIQPTETTTYTVIGDIPFCESDTATFTITVNPTPDIGLLPQMTVFKNTVTPLPIDYPNSQYIHTWTPSTLLSCPDCFNPFFIADSTFSEMTIYVDLLTGEGCSFTDSILVTLGESCGNDLVKLPTAFSPNDDGNNDIFRVRGIGISDIEIFRVYNRWGEQLFETSQLNEGWDGTHKGEKVEQGVYMYYVQAICPLTGEVLTFKGDVFLHF